MEFSSTDVVNIIEIREHLKKNADNDEWFEISGECAKLLFKYITSMEETINILDEYLDDARECHNNKEEK